MKDWVCHGNRNSGNNESFDSFINGIVSIRHIVYLYPRCRFVPAALLWFLRVCLFLEDLSESTWEISENWTKSLQLCIMQELNWPDIYHEAFWMISMWTTCLLKCRQNYKIIWVRKSFWRVNKSSFDTPTAYSMKPMKSWKTKGVLFIFFNWSVAFRRLMVVSKHVYHLGMVAVKCMLRKFLSLTSYGVSVQAT